MKLRAPLALVLSVAAVAVFAPSATAGKTLPGPVYGWSWHETVEVFDATSGASPYMQVAEAVKEWNRSDVAVVMTADRSRANIVVEIRDDACSSGCADFSTITGDTATGTCYVAVKTGAATVPAAEHITIHEIGHCLGLKHNTDPRSVMVPTVSPTNYLTQPGRVDLLALDGLYP